MVRAVKVAKRREARFLGESWHARAFSLFVPGVIRTVGADIRRFERALHTHFDVIAGLGVSGVVPATLLAQHLNRGLLLVRKKGTRLRSGNRPTPVGIASGRQGETQFNYLLVDDLISSGATVNHMIEEISRIGGVPQGIFLYDSYRSDPEDTHRYHSRRYGTIVLPVRSRCIPWGYRNRLERRLGLRFEFEEDSSGSSNPGA